jgi:hypothetical protein
MEKHRCCAEDVKPQFPFYQPNGWSTLLQYSRRNYCYQIVQKYAEKYGVKYDYISFVRPDMVFLSPVTPFSHLRKKPFPHIIFPINENASVIDLWMLIPWIYAENFTTMIDSMFTEGCEKHKVVIINICLNNRIHFKLFYRTSKRTWCYHKNQKGE